MQLTLEGQQVNSLNSIQNRSRNIHHKTAIDLYGETKQQNNDASSAALSRHNIILAINEKEETIEVTGVRGPVKIFSHSRKLLLIRTAEDNHVFFKIGHLKKGRYLLEAEHKFFEFVR